VKAQKVLEIITGQKAVQTFGKKRIPSWNVRPGIPIGAKVTVRGKKCMGLLKRLFEAIENRLSKRVFDNHGNLSFGIKSYIDIPGMNYDPELGIFGMDVSVSLERKGFRVKNRKVSASKIGSKHCVKPEEAVEFIKKEFGVVIK